MVLRKKIKTRFKVGEIKRFSFNQNLKMFVMGSSGNSCLLYSTACFLFLFKRDFLFVLGTMMSDFFPPEKEKGEERRKPQTENHGMQPSALLPIPPGWTVSKSHDYHHWVLTHYHSTVSLVHWISC